MSEQSKPTELENGTKQEAAVTKEKDLPPIDPNSVDVMLQIFAFMANRYGFGIGITLNVGGLLVSGMTISRDDYMQALAASIRQGSKGPNWSEETSTFLEDTLLKPIEKPISEDKYTLDNTLYIHLKNAKMFHQSGKPIPSGEGFLWRGRINAVDGFSLGQLSYSDNQS